MNKFDRLTKILLTLLVVGVWGLLFKTVGEFTTVGAQIKPAANQPGEISPVIRARGLIIVDEKGQERVMIGSPIPDTKDGKRISPMAGIAILDPEGYERAAFGMMGNGNMILGLDAPRGKGDDRNRERLHLIADSEGGATLRFLNRKTGVPGWLKLGDDDKLYLEFLDVQPENNKVIRRKLSMKGEETVEEKLNN